MRFAVYVAVLMIALGSVLLGLDWQPAPMSPMVDTEAGLHGPVSLPPPPTLAVTAPATPSPQVTPKANIGAPIVPPKLTAPANQPATPQATPAVPVQAGVAPPTEPSTVIAAPESAPPPQAPPNCNVDACTAAYRSFRAADCTYQPSEGPRRLCSKQAMPAIR
jgi:hypothetical protein